MPRAARAARKPDAPSRRRHQGSGEAVGGLWVATGPVDLGLVYPPAVAARWRGPWLAESRSTDTTQGSVQVPLRVGSVRRAMPTERLTRE
jgi:hypothetical protein